MTPESVLQVAREAVTIILYMAVPVVGVGLVVGLTVSIFQATTQITEPTLAFIPKIISVFLAIMFFSGWLTNTIVEFTLRLWEKGLGLL
ncbi:MAG: flagellar biosynthesis protein FliQ [Firmicutes bacterium]|mgnify:CR=1 FL=1|nr:flagellar biosynthesis protein FliQ [Bacillota bacterium]